VASITGKEPRALHTQLFIGEFNVVQGGPGDTSANAGRIAQVDGGHFWSSIGSEWNGERPDRALFELSDGAGPSRYWGRWGILDKRWT